MEREDRVVKTVFTGSMVLILVGATGMHFIGPEFRTLIEIGVSGWLAASALAVWFML